MARGDEKICSDSLSNTREWTISKRKTEGGYIYVKHAICKEDLVIILESVFYRKSAHLL